MCVCVCVCLNGSLRGNRAKTGFGHCLGEHRRFCEEDACLRYASREDGPTLSPKEKGGDSIPTPTLRLNCPSSQRGLPGESGLDTLSPEQLRTGKGQQVGLFFQTEPTSHPRHHGWSLLSPYLEHNWGYWWGTGWDCRQGLLPGRL